VTPIATWASERVPLAWHEMAFCSNLVNKVSELTAGLSLCVTRQRSTGYRPYKLIDGVPAAESSMIGLESGNKGTTAAVVQDGSRLKLVNETMCLVTHWEESRADRQWPRIASCRGCFTELPMDSQFWRRYCPLQEEAGC
jgi:hypothetical protein